MSDYPYFREDNTEGYSRAELDRLNELFAAIVAEREIDEEDYDWIQWAEEQAEARLEEEKILKSEVENMTWEERMNCDYETSFLDHDWQICVWPDGRAMLIDPRCSPRELGEAHLVDSAHDALVAYQKCFRNESRGEGDEA
jgi:hypothetical protein